MYYKKTTDYDGKKMMEDTGKRKDWCKLLKNEIIGKNNDSNNDEGRIGEMAEGWGGRGMGREEAPGQFFSA